MNIEGILNLKKEWKVIEEIDYITKEGYDLMIYKIKNEETEEIRYLNNVYYGYKKSLKEVKKLLDNFKGDDIY